MRPFAVVATAVASLGLALVAVAATFGTVAACASTDSNRAPMANALPATPTPTPAKPVAPMAMAVRQKAASDFACVEGAVSVAMGSTRGTLRPGHDREVWTATGCGKSATYVAVCAFNEDGERACNAVAVDGNAEQMSPYGE